jgi:cell wall-associated NlpC family hydrolase
MFQPGDILLAARAAKTYYHAGVYLGENKIAHVTGQFGSGSNSNNIGNKISTRQSFKI